MIELVCTIQGTCGSFVIFKALERGSRSNIYQRLTHQIRIAQDTQWRLLAVLLR